MKLVFINSIPHNYSENTDYTYNNVGYINKPKYIWVNFIIEDDKNVKFIDKKKIDVEIDLWSDLDGEWKDFKMINTKKKSLYSDIENYYSEYHYHQKHFYTNILYTAIYKLVPTKIGKIEFTFRGRIKLADSNQWSNYTWYSNNVSFGNNICINVKNNLYYKKDIIKSIIKKNSYSNNNRTIKKNVKFSPNLIFHQT